MTDAQSGSAVRFSVLGPLQVWRGDARLSLGGPRQERALAALLIDPGHAVSLSRLIDAVWDGDPPTTATHQIRKIMAQLRSLLGTELIITDGPGYRISVSRDQLDYLLFEWHLARARDSRANALAEAIAHLRDALALWRGPALTGMDGPVLAPAAVMLDESRLAALELLASIRLANDDAAELIGDLRRLLDLHPLRETLRAQLILALYRSGRQAEALTVYDEGRHLISDELGVDPSRELNRLYEQILRNDPALSIEPAARAAPEPAESGPAEPTRAAGTSLNSTLPYDIPDFTGRSIEMSALLTIVPEAAQQALTIVTVDGMAGIGKSALAVHAAYRLADRFPDGQLFLDLHGFTAGRQPLDPSDALDMLLRAIGVGGEQIPEDLADRSAMWRARVAGRSIVLLLDNAAESAQVRPLMPGAPGSLVIVTSRARLSGLDGAVPISLFPPPAGESLALVTRLLGAERIEAEPEAVRELIDVCGDLPLALRVAAAKLNNRPRWTIAHLVSRLRSAERSIDELSVDDRSVAAAFRLSYAGLGPDHRRTFRLLGLHPSVEFGPRTTAVLAGISLEKAEDILEDLLDSRLIEQRLQGQYTFHNLFRRYAHSLAREDDSEPEQQQALGRLFDYALLTVRHLAALIQPGLTQPEIAIEQPTIPVPTVADTVAAYTFLDTEYASVLAVARAGSGLGFDRHAGHLACELSYYLQVRGHSRTQAELLQNAVDAARRIGDQPLELRALVNLFVPLWHFGRFPEARECADAARELAERLGDVRAQGVCLSRIGTVCNSLGRYAEAIDYHRRALEVHVRSGNRRQEASSLIGISVAQDALGRYAEALASARAALQIELDLGDESRQLVAMVNVANAQGNQGDLEQAMATLDDVSELAERVRTPLGSAMITAKYAEISRRLGRYDDALSYGQRAHAALVPLDRPEALADLENVLGDIYFDRGEYDEALASHQQALRRARVLNLRIEIVRGLDGVARALQQLRDCDGAREHWRQALEAASSMGGIPHVKRIAESLQSLS